MDLIQQAIDAIIRPPRTHYDHIKLPLILDTGEEDSPKYIRHPLAIENKRGQKLICSLYHSMNIHTISGGPCVIYLHGNASSQLEGQLLVPNLCNYGIFVFCFDFAGCGCSDGDYISLGFFETQDTDYLISFLNESFKLNSFILWGRSMGAATALLCRNPLIKAVISDSSFTSVSDMCSCVAENKGVPSLLISTILWFLKLKIQNIMNFDINEVSPLKFVQNSNIPLLIGHATDDRIIPFNHSKTLFENYLFQNKNLINFSGGHNGRRQKNWIESCVKFILNNFNISYNNLWISECRKLQSQDSHLSELTELFSKIKLKNVDITNLMNLEEEDLN